MFSNENVEINITFNLVTEVTITHEQMNNIIEMKLIITQKIIRVEVQTIIY